MEKQGSGKPIRNATIERKESHGKAFDLKYGPLGGGALGSKAQQFLAARDCLVT
jgi:hypothetical protein